MAKNTLILFLLFYSIVSSQTHRIKAIDSLFAKWNQPNSPGFSVGIIKDSKCVYAKGFGLANLEYNIPNSPSSVFRIASTSKQFTAACIILLIEQGKLNLNNTLNEYFPNFPEYSKNITIRHLLNHTSGIRDYLTLAYLKNYESNDYYDDNDIMRWLVNQNELNFKLGSEYLYSNSGYWLLGQIVNKVTGINMADFAEKEIFEPLGMVNTHFHNDHNHIVKNRAVGYIPKDDNDYSISTTTLDMIGDGGVFTTINDMKKWDDEFYKRTFFSDTFWNLMTTQGILNNENQIEYASGLFIGQYKGLKTISHGGAFVGYRAEYIKFPEQKISIILLANRGDIYPTGICYQIADILFKDDFVESEKDINITQKKEEFITIPISKLEQFSGHYWNNAGSYSRKIYVKNDTLRYSRSKTNESSLLPVNKNTFKMLNINADILIKFERDSKDNSNMVFSVNEGNPFISKKYTPKNYKDKELQKFVGDYYSKELDMYYKLKVEKGTLQLYINDTKFLMKSIMENFFTNNRFGNIQFILNSDTNTIRGFNLARGRVKNLIFNKVE
ncbi:serine hydrolase domain-containing protein [Aquimarina megaterium]|uniref:serine hydrolase domain-containing protein n=1 Tax=Aquimarina megaterium TaxID=1443666 RepID=UPI000945017E|nr:serine hydrolase domain-containing protein [Aquimarina megaterium]